MKTTEKEEARRLRGEGCSVREIANKIAVSVGSVSRWVRDISLTEGQLLALQERNPTGCGVGREKASKSCSQTWEKRRLLYQEEGRVMAKERDVDFIAGCMLYWAEGDKSRNMVGLANTDKVMLRFFVQFLRTWFGVKDDDFTLKVQWYSSSGNSTEDVQSYWTKTLGLPLSCVRKFQIDNVSKYSQKKRGNKHSFGTCTVRVNRTDIVQKIYGAIQEYGNFANEKWLV